MNKVHQAGFTHCWIGQNSSWWVWVELRSKHSLVTTQWNCHPQYQILWRRKTVTYFMQICIFFPAQHKYWNDYSGRARTPQFCFDRWSPTSTMFSSNNILMPKPNYSNFILPPITLQLFSNISVWYNYALKPLKNEKDTKCQSIGDNSWNLSNLKLFKMLIFPSTCLHKLKQIVLVGHL